MPRHNFSYRQDLIPNAKTLRKNMTRHERHLWYDFLRTLPIKWYRQRAIDHYIADFYCPAAKLVVELDGDQHGTPESMAYDNARTAALAKAGIHVLRFSNRDIDEHFEGVCLEIQRQFHQRRE